MALNLGDNPGICDELAQKFGALALTKLGCSPVSGKTIEIGEDKHSVMEGFEITNFNFHTNGNQPPAVTQNDLPGPVLGGGSSSMMV